MNNLIGWAYTTRCVRIISDGTPWRPLAHVEDISAAFLAVLEAPRDAIHNQAFNVEMSMENYRVRDLAAIVLDTVPDCTIVYAGTGSLNPRNYRVDFSKFARTFPAFTPRWDARRGALKLYQRFQETTPTLDALQSRFTRLAWMTALLRDNALDDTLRRVPQ